LREKVPARLLAALGAAETGSPATTVVPFRPPVRSLALRHILTAVAASIAILLVGIGIGYLQFAPAASIRPATGESGAFETALYDALERDQPGAAVGYDDAAGGRSGTVTVVGKVPASFGDACREFRHEWTQGNGKGLETGVACRSTTGDWSVLTVPQGPVN